MNYKVNVHEPLKKYYEKRHMDESGAQKKKEYRSGMDRERPRASQKEKKERNEPLKISPQS